ncbi:MucR family transcriptional regulator [Methylobacterium sp. 092160098-2]|uniref:MucR family transcriptional regulator n=1 Tax=Methylobacterium sp. 092160098-2 TaxID=3025129 RepID=UPI002381D17D|nr:MucR family transcriptional regulator [Methylobacterium sp. 092160098-2]MDE4914559.1 MucR family transcriptional regulator [Methylobacterium sp. 092160098-2]
MINQNSESSRFIETAANLVAAYVSNNSVPSTELPALIASIHNAVAGLGTGSVSAAAVEEVAKPTAGAIRKSISDDGIVSFIDGKSYKTLKRHLTSHGVTPQQYRERYGLPQDYPMVAPSYAAKRSELAKAIGLGQVGARQTQAEATVEKKTAPRKKAA